MEYKYMLAFSKFPSAPNLDTILIKIRRLLNDYKSPSVKRQHRNHKNEVAQLVNDIDKHTISTIPEIMTRLKAIESPPVGPLADLIIIVQTSLFLQLREQGWSLLYQNSKRALAFSEVLKILEPEQIIEIITSGPKESMLIAALIKVDEAVDNILESLHRLTGEQKNRILLLICYNHNYLNQYNALMVAAKYHPRAVIPLLALIKTLEFEVIESILFQRSDEQKNALMLAAETNPQVVEAMLQFIMGLDPNLIVNILSILSNRLENVLMIVARHCPQNVHLMLGLIDSLSQPNVTAEFLLQTNTQGKMAVDIVLTRHPAYNLIRKATDECAVRNNNSSDATAKHSLASSSDNPNVFFSSVPSILLPEDTVCNGLQDSHSGNENDSECDFSSLSVVKLEINRL